MEAYVATWWQAQELVKVTVTGTATNLQVENPKPYPSVPKIRRELDVEWWIGLGSNRSLNRRAPGTSRNVQTTDVLLDLELVLQSSCRRLRGLIHIVARAATTPQAKQLTVAVW